MSHHNALLPPEEVAAITGYRRPSAQLRFLVDVLGVPAWRNAKNEVIVYRSQLLPAETDQAAAAMPDFDALDNVV